MPEAVKLAQQRVQSVLIVTSAATLSDGASAARALKFVRELSDHGWLPTLLLAASSTESREASAASLPPDIPVTYVPLRGKTASDGLQTMSGRTWLWCAKAVRAGRRVVRSQVPAAIFTIGASPMFHIVGRWLAGVTNTPWIADLPEAPEEAPPVRRHLLPPYREQAYHTVQHAEHWVAASSGLHSAWVGLRRSTAAPDSRIIRTGFDAASVSEPVRLIPEWVHRETFRVVCLCTPHSHHAVQRLLQAVAALLRQQVLSASGIHIDIAFASDPEQTQACRLLINQLHLGCVASLSPFRSDAELQRRIQTSSAVILAGEAGPTSGKLVSYLCECMPLHKPVLALSCDAETQDILARTQVGTNVPKGNIPATIAAVAELVRSGNSVSWYDPRWSVIREFSSTYQAQQLSSFLEQTARKQNTRPVDGSWHAPTLRQG